MSRKTSDAIEIMDRRYREQVPNWDEEVAEEEMRVRVGILVHDLRKKAGMTQKELAEKMKITQPMLSKLENGDYDGSALDMLWRACLVLRIRLDINCRMAG